MFLMSARHSSSVISDAMRATCVFWHPHPPPPHACSHTHAHIKDNASFHIHGRVTISYLASQPCQAHNESLHQWTKSLPSTIQMGVYRLSLCHHVLPSHYRPASYFHDACFRCAPVKVHAPLYKHTGTLLFLGHEKPWSQI